MPIGQCRHHGKAGRRVHLSLSADGPTVIVVRTKPQLAHLGYGSTHARGRPRVTRELRASTFIGMSADNATEQMSLIGTELTRRTEQLGAAVASAARAESTSTSTPR